MPRLIKTRVGIIGCGRTATQRAQALAHTHALSLFDQNPHSARALAAALPQSGEHHCALSIHALLHDPGIRWVIVATYNRDLFEIAKRCLEAGKPVLIEKPGAISSEQLMQLQKTSARAQLPVAIGYNHRHRPAIRRSLELFKSGMPGQPFLLRARYGHGGRFGYEQEWRMNPSLSGGGELMDQGAHLIDLARCFLGQPEDVQGHVAQYFWNAPVEDNAFLSMRYRSGATAWMHASSTEWQDLFSLEVYGPRAKIQVDGPSGTAGAEKLTIYRMKPEMGPPETEILEFADDDSWLVEMMEFERWILDPGRGPGNLATLESGIEVLKAVEKLKK